MIYGNILDNINYPVDVKGLKDDELAPLCAEIREFLIESVSKQAAIWRPIWGLSR